MASNGSSLIGPNYVTPEGGWCEMAGSLHREPAVEVEGLAGHVIRGRGSEVEGQEPDLAEPPLAPERNGPLRVLDPPPVSLLAHGHRIGEEARGDGVDLDAVGGPFERQRPREAHQ